MRRSSSRSRALRRFCQPLHCWSGIARHRNPSGGTVMSLTPVPIGDDVPVHTFFTDLSVTALTGGNFIVTWDGSLENNSGVGNYGQLYDENGTPVGSVF